MQTTYSFLKLIVIFVVACALLFVADRQLTSANSINNQARRNEAIQDCFQASEVSYQTEAKAQVTEPVKHYYKLCVEDKGYTTKVD